MGIFRQKPDPLEIRHRNSGMGMINVWLPPVLAIAVIATESTAMFGADHTSNLLRPIIEHIFGPIPDAAWLAYHHLIRKTGHFVGYGLVCLAFLRAWLLQFAGTVDLTRTTWRLRSSIAAILSTAAVASMDEWHQTLLPNRTGRAADVLLDSCGATFVVLATWLILWRRRSSRGHRQTRTAIS